MYSMTLGIHNLLRWLLFANIGWLLIRTLAGWLKNKHWSKQEELALKISVILADVQLLLGLSLYFLFSPIVQNAMNHFKNTMQDATLRFYAVEHPSIMFLGIILIHIAKITAGKKMPNANKHRYVFLFYLIIALVLASRSPWTYKLIPSF